MLRWADTRWLQRVWIEHETMRCIPVPKHKQKWTWSLCLLLQSWRWLTNWTISSKHTLETLIHSSRPDLSTQPCFFPPTSWTLASFSASTLEDVEQNMKWQPCIVRNESSTSLSFRHYPERDPLGHQNKQWRSWRPPYHTVLVWRKQSCRCFKTPLLRSWDCAQHACNSHHIVRGCVSNAV